MKKLCVFLLLLVACSRKGPHKGAQPPAQTSDVIDYNRVQTVFANHCSTCHPSRSGPNWLNYSEAKTFALNGRLKQRVFTDRSMPPAQSREAATLTDSDRQMLAQWADSGALFNIEGKAPDVAQVQPSLVNRCLECHGSAGPGPESDPRIPRLMGQNKQYLVAQLTAFKWRTRIDPSERMNEVALSLKAGEIEELAEYFSSKSQIAPLEIVNTTPEDQFEFTEGKQIAATLCNSCHANNAHNGDPSSNRLPVLRGQSKAYLLNQLLYFKSGERRNRIMEEVTKSLSEPELESVSLYYSKGRP